MDGLWHCFNHTIGDQHVLFLLAGWSCEVATSRRQLVTSSPGIFSNPMISWKNPAFTGENGFKRRLPIFPIHYSWFLEHLPANIPQIASHHIPILSLFCSVKYPSYLYIVLLVESAILIKWYYINFGIGWILSLRVEFPLHGCPGQNMD